MTVGECIVAIIGILCATLLGLCLIFKDEIKVKTK